MPVDASIYSQLAPQRQMEGPLDQFGRAMQIKNLMGAGQLQGLQLQQAQNTLDKEQRVKELFARGNVTPEALSAVDPAMGMQLQKFGLEKRNLETGIEKNKTEIFGNKLKQARDLIAQARSDQDMPFVREQVTALLGPQFAARIPERFDPAWQQSQIVGADDVIKNLEAKRGRDVTIRGQDLTARTARLGQAETGRHNLATEAAAAGTATREALAKLNTQENLMRDDFTNASKEFVKVRDAHQRVMSSAQDPSAAGDLALIFNYMKVLDPGSTVREGEFANAQNSGGVDQRTISMYNSIMRGERLSPDIRADFLDRSGRLYNAAVQNQETIEQDYTAKATRAKARPEQVVTKFRVKGNVSTAPTREQIDAELRRRGVIP